MAKKSVEKRKLILEHAERIFSQKGFSAVTMKDIIDACHISRGGIYLYFSSTDEIFMEVIKLHHQDCMEVIKNKMNKDNDFQDIIDEYFQNLKQDMKNIKGSLKLAMIEFFISHKAAPDNDFFVEAMNGLKAPIFEMLSLGKNQNKISYQNISEIADLVFYWLIGLEEIMLSTDVPEKSINDQIDLMKNLLLSGKLRLGDDENERDF